ncbi:MAG: hypothetical protein HPKKFMNG_00739 [Planctomycetes bacterium]|nr:hypothetical protein [Planctomycetota bacterium]HRJ77269.1 AAA family ATPase [Planctomycetota bacterium]
MHTADSPHFTGLPFAKAERVIQTHANIVVLIGDRAYKLKKPVKFPFLDYSTPALRRHFVQEEVRLNRRFSPDTYLGVCEVRNGGGRLLFSPVVEPGQLPTPDNEVVDYALCMRRISDDAWLPARIREGRVPATGIRAIVDRVVRSLYTQSPTPEVEAAGLPQSLARNTVANVAECERFTGRCMDLRRFKRLDDLLRGRFDTLKPLFEQRVQDGRIRDGHGDLKPGNIAFEPDGTPLITDCIEFGTQWRYLDTLAEVAFLATGLESVGQFALAAQVFEHYRVAARDEFSPALRRYYQCHFACVMGKVTALQLDEPEVGPVARHEAQRLATHYFALADFHAREPHLIAVGGIMGCGKSTLASALSAHLGWPVLSSDVIRKELAGVPPTQRLGEPAYRPEVTRLVYAELMRRATAERGAGVIVDAQFGRAEERAALKAAAASLVFVHCDAPDDVVRERMRRRAQDAARVSDATEDLLLQARARYEPVESGEGLNLLTVDTTRETAVSVEATLAALLGPDFLVQGTAR